MSIDVKYRTAATATGGRDGRTRTEDGKLDLQLSIPKEIGGPGGDGWWPEEDRNQFDFAFAYTDFQKPLQVSQIRVQRWRGPKIREYWVDSK